MASIQEYLNQIKNAIYGKDVRQAIHDGIQQCYYDGHAGAVDLSARQRLDTDEANITSLTSRMSVAENDINVLDARVDQIANPLQIVEQSILDGGGSITYYVFKELKLVIAYFTLAGKVTIVSNHWYNYATPSEVGVPAEQRSMPMVGGANGNVGGMLRVNTEEARIYLYSGNVGSAPSGTIIFPIK